MSRFSMTSKPRIKAFSKRTFVVMLAGLLPGLFGCSSAKSTYPAGWPLRIDVAVPDLSGNYHPALVPLLNNSPLDTAEITGCSYDFIITAEQIKYRKDCAGETEALSAPYVPLSSTTFNIRLKQKKEGLQIIFRPRTVADNPVAGYQKEYLLLSKTMDGSLVVQKVGKVYGLAFMIFPVAASESSWYRFYDGKMEIAATGN